MAVLTYKDYKTKLLPVKNHLYGLSYAPENQERIYYFLLIDSEKEERFLEAIQGQQAFDIREYATVITPGHSEPPADIKEQLRLRYNAIL